MALNHPTFHLSQIVRWAVLILTLLGTFTLLDSCSSGADAEGPEEIFPTQLSLTAEWNGSDGYNPYGDGSGSVKFTATAQQATRYEFDLGDGTQLESPNGIITHQYEQEGIHDYTVVVTAYASSGESARESALVTVYRSNDEFPRIAWTDEFDQAGTPDGDKWHHQVIPPLNGGWFNGEQQHYTDREENSFVSEGTLKIMARKEDYTTQGSTRSYTSARMNSKFAFTYGRVVVRAKLPPEAGTWPAIWTLGANINETGNYFGTQYGSVGWPACGEIDILEQTGWNKSETIAHFHWGHTQTGVYGNAGGTIANPDSTTGFHDYILEWNETSLKAYVDDQLVYELENTTERPYDNPHYILLNIAMGGNLGGVIPVGFTTATMEIDYVRVYQKAGDEY